MSEDESLQLHSKSDIKDISKLGFEMFKIHADQRLKFLQSFPALYAASFAAAGFLISINKWAAAIAFFSLTALSSLFWLLERRTKQLLKKSELIMMLDPGYRMILETFEEGKVVSYGVAIKIFYVTMIIVSAGVALMLTANAYQAQCGA